MEIKIGYKFDTVNTLKLGIVPKSWLWDRYLFFKKCLFIGETI